MSRTVQTSGPPGGAQRPPGIELSGFYLHGSRDPPSVSKHYLVLHGVVAAAVGGSIYSNFLFLEILSILPVVTGPMLVQWLGFSQEQALSSLLNISPPGMSKFPLPSPSCNADLSYSIAPAVTCLVPLWFQCPGQGLLLWLQPGDACCSRRPVEALDTRT